MKVLALIGGQNCGKSETLNIVYHLLLLNGYTQVPGYFQILGNPVMKDCIDVFEKDNKIIGIVTQGDYVIGINSIAAHLSTLSSAHCVTAICACTNKNPKAELQVKAYPDHHLFHKVTTSPSLQRIANNIDAQTIFSAI